MSISGQLPHRPLVPSSRGALASRGAQTGAEESIYLAGSGISMQRVRSQLERIAPYFRMALITGEVGTGKETVARVLHARSVGADGPFVVWRAAKFVERLVQADQDDLLQNAYGGTLFLDEIRGVPFAQQPRLLRLLREQEMRAQRCDLRIIAASDHELRPLTATGQFREDLHRRIAAVEIGLPPLRKRPEDLAGLTQAVLRRAGVSAISAEAATRLEQHSWPGNVREMREVLERAAALAQGLMVEARHLPLPERAAETAPSSEKLQDVVQRHVLEVLTRCSGNKLRASEVLGISRSTLYRMLDACADGSDAGYPG